MEVEILAADLSDATAILALQKLAYQTEAQLYQDWSIPPLKQTLDDIRAQFHSKVFLKAVSGGRIIGSVRAAQEGETCAVGGLIVHPDYRRSGIGTSLLQVIETMFPSAERFELFTGERSEGNIRLYSRLGYRALRKERLSPKVVMVFMEKRRSPGA